MQAIQQHIFFHNIKSQFELKPSAYASERHMN